MVFGSGGGGFEVPDQPAYEPMTFEQHSLLLDKEAEIANLRDEQQRNFILEQEEMRLQQEEADRLRIQQEQTANEMELRQQEQEAAGASLDTGVDIIKADVDDVVANMYGALLGGVEAGGEAAGGEPIPE